MRTRRITGARHITNDSERLDVAIVEDRFTLVFQSAEGSRFTEHAPATPKAR
jgi:hypothetical protein